MTLTLEDTLYKRNLEFRVLNRQEEQIEDKIKALVEGSFPQKPLSEPHHLELMRPLLLTKVTMELKKAHCGREIEEHTQYLAIGQAPSVSTNVEMGPHTKVDRARHLQVLHLSQARRMYNQRMEIGMRRAKAGSAKRLLVNASRVDDQTTGCATKCV